MYDFYTNYIIIMARAKISVNNLVYPKTKQWLFEYSREPTNSLSRQNIIFETV